MAVSGASLELHHRKTRVLVHREDQTDQVAIQVIMTGLGGELSQLIFLNSAHQHSCVGTEGPYATGLASALDS